LEKANQLIVLHLLNVYVRLVSEIKKSDHFLDEQTRYFGLLFLLTLIVWDFDYLQVPGEQKNP